MVTAFKVAFVSVSLFSSIALSKSLANLQADSTVADTLFTNAQIYTMDPSNPWASTLAVKSGEIIYLGEAGDAKTLVGSETVVHNLNEEMILPGLHDVHIHPLESASDATHFTVPGEGSIIDYQNAILAARQEYPNVEWLIGYGHNIDDKDIQRFAKLKVIADAQVVGDFANPKHWPEMIPLIGKPWSAKLIPIKSLLEHGARLTLSSDWNVSSLNPFVGIANAISREPEAISLHQALAAYTINSAYAMRQEHLVGSLEVGKRADFIVLPSNLFTLSAAQIRNIHVLETWIEGRQVYKAPLSN